MKSVRAPKKTVTEKRHRRVRHDPPRVRNFSHFRYGPKGEYCYPCENKTHQELPASGLVSVLMPAYHSWQYIEEAVESALAQSLPQGWDLEVVICVDGCERTAEVVERIQKKEKRVRMFCSPQNRGMSRTFDFLATKVEGDIIECVDSDDVVPPYRLQKQFEVFFAQPDIDLVGGRIQIMGNSTTSMEANEDPKRAFFTFGTMRDMFRKEVHWPHGTSTFKRRVLDRVVPIDRGLMIAGDMGFIAQVLLDEDVYVKVLPLPLVYYRIHPLQLTQRDPAGIEARKDYLVDCFSPVLGEVKSFV